MRMRFLVLGAPLLAMIAVATASCGGGGSVSSPASSPSAPAPVRTGVAVVSGKLVTAGTTTPFSPKGLTSVGIVYPTPYAALLCSSTFQASPAATSLQQAQAALTAPPLAGLSYNASFQAMTQVWKMNTVRLQLSQGALQYEKAHNLSTYTQMVRDTVAQARASGLVVILAMQSETYGCSPYENGAEQKLPDVNTEQAWSQLLDQTLTSDTGVMLEIFNEPDASLACGLGSETQPDWTAWATGCGAEPDQGMLTVGQYVSTLAPNNVLLFDGQGLEFAFQGFTVPAGMPVNAAYTFHPYLYVFNGTLSGSSTVWDASFGNFAASGHAVVVTEWNEAFKCPTDPGQAITNDFILTYLPAHGIGMVGYAWDAPAASNGYLVNSYAFPGNAANYQLVDPNTSGCAEDGGAVLQQLFQAS